MLKRTKALETISQMICQHTPGADEEMQLLHLIEANAYMREHDCTLSEALSGTAKREGDVPPETITQLDQLLRARAYLQAHGGTVANALRKTATSSGTARNCMDIAEQLDHIMRAKDYQMENKCGQAESLSLTASK